MRYFTQDGNRLIWRNNGETLIISPWGPDSMRVQSVLMGEIRDDRWALLDQQPTEAVLDIRDESASITVGKLTARITMDDWHHYATLSFYNQKAELLLRETAPANALSLRSRKFEPHLGGDFTLTVTFEGRDGESIRGMGQYQEETLD